jgi:hypothetical protein
VNALRRIHAALVPGGLVVDTQPVSARPPVCRDGRRLGTLDMREWIGTVDAVDALVAQTIDEGLYEIERELQLVVTDTYDNGAELVEHVSGWKGTRISHALAARVAGAAPPVTLDQDVRLRLLRATEPLGR